MGGFPSNEQDDPIIPTKGAPLPKRKEEVLAKIVKRPLESEPGNEYRYSNAGYVVLGLVIEAASGKSYEQYCQEAVFRPAGLPENCALVAVGFAEAVARRQTVRQRPMFS